MHVAGDVVPGRHESAFRDNYLTPSGSGDHTTDAGAAYTEEDPIRPNAVNPRYDTGDGVLAIITGQQAIADYIALETIG